MKKNYLFIVCIILLFAACRQHEPISQLKEINEALERANLIIEDNNKLAYMELSGKLNDPRTYDQALIWEPKAMLIWRRAFESKSLIDSLKNALIKQSDSLRNHDRAIVKQVMDANENKLFETLVLFEDSLGYVFDTKAHADNPYMIENLKKDSITFLKNVIHFDVKGYPKSAWLSKNFANCSPLMALLVLNKIETNLINEEWSLIDYCNVHTMYNFCGYYKPGALASLDNSVVKSGDTILVSAGVGVFAKEMSPRNTINGTLMKLYENPVARYEFIATGKPGTYSLPVKIEYMDSDGSRKTEVKNLGYIITDNK